MPFLCWYFSFSSDFIFRCRRQNEISHRTFIRKVIWNVWTLHRKVSISIFLIIRDFLSSLLSVTLQLQSNCEIFPTENDSKRVPNQLSVAEKESQKMQQYGVIQGLLRESNCLREELHNLRCLTRIKVEERGQKHRELLRAEVQYKHTHTHTHTGTFKIGFNVIISAFLITFANTDMHISHQCVKNHQRGT